MRVFIVLCVGFDPSNTEGFLVTIAADAKRTIFVDSYYLERPLLLVGLIRCDGGVSKSNRLLKTYE